jgi:hypothetical protein
VEVSLHIPGTVSFGIGRHGNSSLPRRQWFDLLSALKLGRGCASWSFVVLLSVVLNWRDPAEREEGAKYFDHSGSAKPTLPAKLEAMT